MSKTESRFKSKLESLKKFQHSASTNTAVEKARAFFRSLELKHLGVSSNHEHIRQRNSIPKTIVHPNHAPTVSSSSKVVTLSSISSSSSSSIIDDSHTTNSTTTTTNDSSFITKIPSNGIATARIIRVVSPQYSNPRDMIVHRVLYNEEDDQRLLSQMNNHPTKQYHDQYDLHRRSSGSNLNSKTVPSIRLPNSSETLSNRQMSTSLYNYRPLVCREMDCSSSLMSSSFHESSHRSLDPIIRPLSSSVSSSSMSTWTQSVRRLNTEYTSTINALQQAKESLGQTYPESTDTISKYANLVTRGIDDLLKAEPTKSLGATFCLTTPIAQESSSLSSKTTIQPSRTPSLTLFCKPKLVRPLDLEIFVPSIPSLPKLEPAPIISDTTDSIESIIKKFNNLNHTSSSQVIEKQKEMPSKLNSAKDNTSTVSNTTPRVHFQPSVTTYELEEIPYESPPPPLSSSSSSSSVSEDSTSSTSTSTSNDSNQVYENHHFQEETSYTVETFYKNKSNSTSNNQEVVVIRESTTEEQFNSAQDKQQHSDGHLKNQQTPSQHSPADVSPLLTYLDLKIKQMPPTSENYHPVEPSSNITKDFISDVYHDEDDETIHDVVTINPHTHSPPSQRLISSSSSTSSSTTTSSAATVLLSNSNNPLSSKLPITNGQPTKSTNKSPSQLPKRISTAAATTTTNPNNSRLNQSSKVISSASKLKPPSTTVTKATKSMIVNSVPTASSMRKPTGMMNQSSTMTNTIVNKVSQQSTLLSTVPVTKKQQLVNGTESQNSTDSSVPAGKNRVRSMVNQLNAAVSSTSRPAISSTIANKQTSIPSSNARRLVSMEATANPMTKTTITSPNRPVLQRAMTISNNSPITPSLPSTPPTNGNHISSTYKRKTPLIRSTSNVKEGLLRWCQAQVAGYPNVSVTNLSSSWADGLAFCALTHHFFPDAFNFKSLSSTNRKENFELAFRVAEERAGVPRLLDVSDMLTMGNTPDYKCIFTYLNSFLAKAKDLHPTSNGV